MPRSPTKPPKLDLKKQYRALYKAKTGTVQAVNPGKLSYLCYSGRGDPNHAPAYAQAVEALFSTSYFLKFDLRKRTGVNYGVMPLQGLWWSEDMQAFTRGDRSVWLWTMMILQPTFVTADDVDRAKTAVAAKRKISLENLRFETFDEGPCAQTLHVGPFTEEGPTIATLHAWIADQGHQLSGKHHEIYLSDIRLAPSSRWKTIIRQPYQ